MYAEDGVEGCLCRLGWRRVAHTGRNASVSAAAAFVGGVERRIGLLRPRTARTGLEGQGAQLRCSVWAAVTRTKRLRWVRASGRHVLLLLLLRMTLAEATVMLLLLRAIGLVGRLGTRARGRKALAHLGRTLGVQWTAKVPSAASCAHGRVRTRSTAGKGGPLRRCALRRPWWWTLAEMGWLSVQDLEPC